ncbi:hypothetical protein [Streptomyces sp. H27-D2]|uniref:hypothetical protein n=1 Tax=Streptomyces sp. H27-D2 TaxID=3046304 RepID=UPI002DB91012|nr:hypothetical protein [Streptomyces sp. H27-D2]MEC4016507.1 hypothetical protein [Streptomyces sp. H27-D2]
MTAPTSAGTTSGDSGIPPLSFTAPDGFQTLPLAATPEERTVLADTFVRELYSNGDESLWTPAAPYYAAIAEFMGDNGLSYSAMGLFADDAGGVAQCAFTVAAIDTDHSDPEVAAHGIQQVLAHDPLNDARWLDLPCGPAVSCITLREFVLGSELTASGEGSKLLTGQIQAHVPFPAGPYTAVFTLYTASINYWSEFCDMTAAILHTVSFADLAPIDRLTSSQGRGKDVFRC